MVARESKVLILLVLRTVIPAPIGVQPPAPKHTPVADVGVPVAVPHFERSHIPAYQERRTLQMLHIEASYSPPARR
jgi:hypothetical protein